MPFEVSAPRRQVLSETTPNTGVFLAYPTMRTAKLWVETAGKASARQRRDLLRNLVVGNGWLPDVPDTHSMSESEKAQVWKTVYQAVENGVSALRRGAVDVYQSINALIDYMQKKGSSPTTISGHKHKLVKFYRYLKLSLDEDDLEDVVKKVDSVSVTDDRNLTRQEIREALIHGNPKQKALVSFLVCTGARLGEVVQVKLGDLDWDRKPVMVRFAGRKTKTKRKRISFLSSECVKLLKAHIADRDRIRQSEWLFDGWIPGRERESQSDKHISPSSAYLQVRKVFSTIGLTPPAGHTKNGKAGAGVDPHLEYHPHVLRSTNLEITKSCGYPTDWAEFLVGHSLGTQESYMPSEDKMAGEWLKRCEQSFCFLKAGTDPADINAEINRRIEKTREEMKDWTKQEVDEIFRQHGRPSGKPFDVIKIPKSDEEGYLSALEDGFEEVKENESYYYMRRKSC